MQRWFPKQNLLHWLPPTIALRLQQIIAVAPRTKKVPNRKEINAIRYNSITASYKPLLKLSLDILSNRGVSFNSDNSQQTKGLLLDVAEIWELYTKKVLELAFSPYFSVVDGNRREGDYLLKANSKEKYLGKLKPDFWVEKTNGQKILVADAKYKKLGDLPWQSPKRDDLYQMTAYLDRYSSDFKGTTQGVLLYPKWPDENSDKVFCEIERESPWLLHSGAELSFMKISTDVLIAVEDLKQLGIIAKMQSA
jgi:5-methylcytosine-specific restriction enzyme subunit McrC